MPPSKTKTPANPESFSAGSCDKPQISGAADTRGGGLGPGTRGGNGRQTTPAIGRWRCPVRRFLDRFAPLATCLVVVATALAGSSDGMKW